MLHTAYIIFFSECRADIDMLHDGKSAAFYIEQKCGKMSNLEHYMIAKVFIKSAMKHYVLGLIWGVVRRQISRIVKSWSGKWGKIGTCLSHLDITAEYLDMECPDEYAENDLETAGTQCDRKDYKSKTSQKSSTLNQAQNSPKVHGAALHDITCSTPAGLVWTYRNPVLSRANPNSIVEWLGYCENDSDKYISISQSDWNFGTDDGEYGDIEEI